MEINPDVSALLRQGTAVVRTDSGQRTADTQSAPSADAPLTDAPVLPLSPAENIAEALKLLGIKPTKEYMAMTVKLIGEGIPVTKENLLKLNHGQKLTGDIEKAVFLLKNGIRINSANAEALRSLENREINTLSLLIDIIEAVEDLDGENLGSENIGNENPENAAAKQEISDILSGGEREVSEREGVSRGTQAETPQAAADVKEMISTGMIKTDVAEEVEKTKAAETVSTETDVVAEDAPAAENARDILKKSAAALLVEVGAQAGEMTGVKRGVVSKERAEIVTGENTDDLPEMPENEKDLTRVRADNTHEEPERKKDVTAKDYSALKQRVLERFAVKPGEDGAEKLNEKLNGLRRSLVETRAALERANTPDDDDKSAPRRELAQKIDNLVRAMDFQNEIKNGVYVQFPVVVEGREMNAELRVFKDGRHGTAGGKAARSALLALDMAYLGRVEAYVKRDGRSVTCQFRADDSTLKLAEEHIAGLASKLGAAGYRLDGYFFKELTESFTVLDGEPGGAEGGVYKSLYNMDFKA